MKPFLLCGLLLLSGGCALEGEQARPSPTAAAATLPQPTIAEPKDRWQVVEQKLAKGVQKDDVYSVVVPRDDFALNHLDLGPVPAAAGIESSFHFFLCPCGKTSVIGQFVLQEHEVNDVIDELRTAHIKVASVAPMMLNARPALFILRFHGEGDVDKLATALNTALEWTGRQQAPNAQR
jgi:hypothetical protein